MSEIKIFTDGACSGNPGIGGWSSIFCFPSGVKIYSGSAIHTTNNRMELTAIVETLAFIYTLYNKINGFGMRLTNLKYAQILHIVSTQSITIGFKNGE